MRGKAWIWGLLKDFIFPRRCPVCDKVVPLGTMICGDCERKLKVVEQPYCMCCGKKLETEAEFCGDCKRISHEYVRGRSLFEYETVATSIYRLKYGNRREYADYFGDQLYRHLGDFVRRIRPDALVPVPMYAGKQRKRGYNQAALLAKALGRLTGVPVRENLIKRVRNTAPLKLQNPRERQNNLKKAFIIRQNDVELKITSIIIIDDIYTTGSTVDEMSRVLKLAGVERIFVITLACGAGV